MKKYCRLNHNLSPGHSGPLSHPPLLALALLGLCAWLPAMGQAQTARPLRVQTPLVAGAYSTAPTPTQAQLLAGFRNPPAVSKPRTWWHWVNGNVTRRGIAADLKAMKQIGLGGATVVNVDVGIPPGPVPFMSPKWRADLQYALQQADQLGLRLCVENCAGWSSSGGPWITPPYAMQMVVFSSTQVHGPTQFSGKLKQPETRLNYYRDIEVLAYPTPKDSAKRLRNIQVKADYRWHYGQQPDITAFPQDAIIQRAKLLNLSAKMAPDGYLTWNVPEGNWTILRIGYTPIGVKNHPAPKAGLGLECDKLSRKALKVHWDGFMHKVVEQAGPLVGKALTSSLIDSYEVGAQNWTPRFRQDFEQLRGYDPLPWLPVLSGRVIESDAASERFLWDVRRTVADLFAKNYYGYFRTLCHQDGLLSHIEPYDGPYECIQSGAGADIPMGEFWVGSQGETTSCKLAASIGHIYNRPVIGAESFTAGSDQGGWRNYPYRLKALGDLAYTTGINRFTFHRYAMQPWLHEYPGMTMGPWGTEFQRTTTWWKQGRAWIHYLTRCQYLLQQGHFVGNVLYFAGEEAPNTIPHHPELKDEGYDYDGCDRGILLHDTMVDDGQIVLRDGMRYDLLVLPNTRFMTPKLLHRLQVLIRQGATVLGPKPTQSPSLTDYPQCDATVRHLAHEIWGNCNGTTVTEHAYGKGHVLWGESVPAALAGLGVKPDFVYTDTHGGGLKPKIAWIHRRIGTTDLYFLSNQRHVSADVTCTFRGTGRQPEFWDAATATVRPAPVWSDRDGFTSVPIHFGPAGSVFVVFGEATGPGNHLVLASSPELPAAAMPQIKIQKAVYEAIDGSGSKDVTAKVAAMVDSGETRIAASNENFGDPTVNHRKRLRITYTLKGKSLTLTTQEGGTIDLGNGGGVARLPVGRLVERPGLGMELEAFGSGTYRFRNAHGQAFERVVEGVPAPIPITGPWTLSFPPHWGAPPQVTFPKLISWNESPVKGVRYFSGTAEYRAVFDLTAAELGQQRVFYLDLGQVKDLCQVTLNDWNLGVWWKPPFAADVTRCLHPGRNVLTVKVTNTWINRLIGDAHYPPDAQYVNGHIKAWPKWLLEGKPQPVPQRYTFTTWLHYTRNSKLVDSGLLGPVVLRVGLRVPVQ